MLEFHWFARKDTPLKVRVLRPGFKCRFNPPGACARLGRERLPGKGLKRENNSNAAAGAADFHPCRAPLRELETPTEGEVHVWYLDLAELGGSLQAALDGSRPANRRPSFTRGQLRFARRFYLRILLGAYLGVAGKSIHILRSPRGKPVLDPEVHDLDLQFSMAKSADRLLIGFATACHVGVDLEPAARRPHRALGVARRYFSAAEAATFEAMPAEQVDRAFLHTWACKEAVVKASGQGIANELCRFTVETDPARPPAVLDFENGQASEWSLALVRPEAGFLGAVALQSEQMTVRTWRLLPAGNADD
jgi:4'-phosphopantetheinyl transferase